MNRDLHNSITLVLKFLWIFTLIIIVWQALWSYYILPERMVSHFDESGNPDGWSSKSSFMLLWYITILILQLVWLIPLLLMRLSLKKLPVWMINVPNKDYWFSNEERKEECARRMNTMVLGIAFLMNFTMILLYQSIVRGNLEPDKKINIWVVFISLGFMFLFTFAYLFTAFRKPKTDKTDK
ncbi:DUF1648 domain-containing protein [Candidatus Poribacteria bacterium]|nr:DUF1648 domain-containing protein [Candidatus Poribacteria bacterium]